MRDATIAPDGVCPSHLAASGARETKPAHKEAWMDQQHQLDANYCYSVKELAFIWNLSDESVTRLVEEEPGVLIFKIQRTGRRRYRNIRVPGRVALRIQNRSTVVDPM